MKGTLSVTLMLVLMRGSEVEMMPEGLKQLTNGFLKVLEACKTELGLPDGILTDMFHLWKEEYELVTRDSGCMFHCMSQKLDLLDPEGKIHHGNTKEYVLKNGGGEDIAAQIVGLAHDCDTQQEATGDVCMRMLGVAKCLRKSFSQIQWSPKMEVVITEIIADA